MEHTEAEREVYFTTRAYFLNEGDHDGAIAKLIEHGFSPVAASLRADLIPMAFGWALLKKMGVEKFPSEFYLSDTGEKVRVSESHVFIAALGLAKNVFETGYTEIFSKRVVAMLLEHSAEVDALNKALNEEPKLDLSEVSITSSLNGYSRQEYTENA